MPRDSQLFDRPWFWFGLAAALVIVAFVLHIAIRPPDRPVGGVEQLASLAEHDDTNLLFVLVDTLRADHLSAYGYGRETSPVMDALAASGVRFARVHAQSSWTKCSMASLWTSLYPVTTGVTRFDHALPAQARLPAEILREAGFRTAGIWRNGWVAPNFGFGQGFELYQRPQPGARPRTLEPHDPSARPPSAPPLLGSDRDITESALEFLRANRDARWFLYLHYMDVHQYVYDTDSAKFGTSYSDLYDNAIHWTDRNLGALLAGLQDHGLLRRTLVVIASDHGEAFREHGHEGHARDVQREVVTTPLILSLPFRLEPGISVQTPVANVDVWPTLLDLLGLPPLPGAQGRSLVPAIEAAARGEEAAAGVTWAHLDRTWARRDAPPDPEVSAYDGRWRLLQHPGAPDAGELYDGATDPLEVENVIESHPEQAQRLRAEIDAYLAKPEAPWGAPARVELDDLKLGQLRALGYVVKEPE